MVVPALNAAVSNPITAKSIPALAVPNTRLVPALTRRMPEAPPAVNIGLAYACQRIAEVKAIAKAQLDARQAFHTEQRAARIEQDRLTREIVERQHAYVPVVKSDPLAGI